MKPLPAYDIRLAAPSDEAGVVSLLRAMHIESGIGPFAEQKARGLVQLGISRQLGMIGVIGRQDNIEASIGLFLVEPPFSTLPILQDAWQFVREDCRRSTRAKSLLEFAKWAAEELRRPLLVTAMVNAATARKVELLGRQLPRAGAMFLYDPTEAAAAAA